MSLEIHEQQEKNYYVMVLETSSPVIVKVSSEDVKRYGDLVSAVKYEYCQKHVWPSTCYPLAVFTEDDFSKRVPILHVKVNCEGKSEEYLVTLSREDKADKVKQKVQSENPGCQVEFEMYKNSIVWKELVMFYKNWSGLSIDEAVWKAYVILEHYVKDLTNRG
jgi:hypothetical protein